MLGEWSTFEIFMTIFQEMDGSMLICVHACIYTNPSHITKKNSSNFVEKLRETNMFAKLMSS